MRHLNFSRIWYLLGDGWEMVVTQLYDMHSRLCTLLLWFSRWRGDDWHLELWRRLWGMGDGNALQRGAIRALCIENKSMSWLKAA